MKKNKILKIFIAIIMLIAQLFLITSSVNAVSIGETKDLERGNKGYYCIQKWNGNKWIYLTYNQTFYTDTDGQKYIAYCLSPGLPGVGYVSGEKETYPVKINKMLEDDRVWRVLKNGYPNKSVNELGLETEDDAYFATMQAINAILRGYTVNQVDELYSVGKFAINGENIQDIKRRGEKTLGVLHNLVDIGINGNETRKQFIQASITKESEFVPGKDGVYYQLYAINSSSEVSEYSIDKTENLPQGSYIADENGNKKQNFKGNEKFKVVIPEASIMNNINGKITVKIIQKNYPIYYGASTIEGFQDFALCNKSYEEKLLTTEINVDTNKSALKILKVDAETDKPLEGVKFNITTSDGNTKEYTTDKLGKIYITNLYPGKIIVKEIQSLDKYSFNPEETQCDLTYNKTKEIKITNKLQKGNIKIIKTDKDNNKIKLQGVEFKLVDQSGKQLQIGKTDKNGELLFSNIVIGKYKIIETKTNTGYDISDKEIEIEVKPGETSTVNISNEKQKGNIKIIKTDKDNNKIKLQGVEFKLVDQSGEQLQTGKTDKNGELLFSNIVIGKYKIIETKTNTGYDILDKGIEVEVKKGETSIINVSNEKQKGNVKIVKIDSDDNSIKLEGVKFQIKDSAGKVIREGKTNKHGELLFENLVIGKYSLVEVETMNGYKLDDSEITFELKNKELKEFKIENGKIVVEKEEKKDTVKKVEEKTEEKVSEIEVPKKELPKTGSNNVGMIIFTINTIVIASTYAVLRIVRKYRNN